MGILSSFLAFFSQTFAYVFFCKDFLDSLAIKMYELKSTRDDVKREVHKAKRDGKEPKSQVKWWLNRVEALERRFLKINEQFQSRFMFPRGFAPNIWSSYRLSKKVDELFMETHYLISKGIFDEVATKPIPDRFEEIPSAPTLGMELILEQLQQLIADDDTGIIGIFGMAGIGKTALLSRFHNEFLAVVTDIDVIIYIETSKDLSVESIQKHIRDRLGLSWKDNKTQKERAAAIFKVLSKMKFVIILDNLWIPLNLQKIGIPIPKQSSKRKIILATRNEDVCDQMDVRKKIKLDCLRWEPAWRLFTEKIGKELISSHPEIQHQAEVLARKCGGLPLALITIARALASKRSPEEWKHAVTLMNNNPAQLPGIEEHLLSPLKASYDNLPNEKLRLCASHFGLHWEGCRIHKNLLQDHWIGEGLIEDFKDIEDANNKVCYLIGTLSTASLVERLDAEGYTKMHPIIRSMVLWAASDQCGKQERRWFVQEKEGLLEAPEANIWQSAYRLALGYNKIAVLPEAPKCPNLFSLKLKNNMSLQKIPDSFFRFMPCLAVLDLHSSPIKELPAAIGNLVMLQFLELYRTKIKSLPQELDALVKLKYLGLNWTTDLIDIPNGVIEKLCELQVLQMTASYGSWNVGSSWEEGVDFEELESLRQIRILDITIGTLAALKRLCESHRLAASTVVLLIKGCQGLRTIKLSSTTLWRHMKSLKWLRLSHSSDLEEVIIDGGGSEEEVLVKLENIVLEHLQKAKFIWTNRYLENLHGLYIYGCNGMEQLVYCKDEEIVTNEVLRVIAPFPNLKELALHGLPELKRVSGEGRILIFPSLETIEILDCPKLKKLNLIAEKLKEVKCQRSWWDRLEWQDVRTKSSFQLLVKPFK